MAIKTVVARTLLIGCCLLLTSCGMFDFLKSSKKEEPNELVDFDEEVEFDRLWSVNVGSGQGDKFNRLHPVMAGNIIYAAGNNGVVVAVNREDGDVVWRTRLDFDITGGVGASDGLVLVGTDNSEVIALNMADGEILWEAQVTSEVLSAPVTNGRVVVTQSIDGKLTGLDAENGSELWIYESSVPALSLRGDSSPLIVDAFVIAAFANGSVVSIALDNGTLRWEERVAVPTGRSEIDRLVDIDGELVVNDQGAVLVPSYQGYLAAIDVVTGQSRWRVEESSEVGASFGFGNIYVVNERDIVRAFRTAQETAVWENDQLLLRKLSPPLGFSNYVAVGDDDGYIHLLAQSDGRFVGRGKVGGGVRSRMLSQGNILYVFSNSGNLVALRIQ
ncbi:MAG: outer membrane protein assembly factor BamB [Pseudomonadota bacterium]